MLIAEPQFLTTSDEQFAPRNAPFEAPVLVNRMLTGPNSGSEKRHVEICLSGSGIVYEAGDALAIVPHNDPQLVERLLTSFGIAEEASVRIDGKDMRLGEALTTKFEIAVATPGFLKRWAVLSGSATLRALAAPKNTEARRRYLRHHHIQDIVRRHRVTGLDASSLISCLRSLQPRLYSIASSPRVNPDIAAITTATLSYDLWGERRRGVVTGYQIPTTRPGSTLSVFVQPDPGFRPATNTDMIMVAAGTGIAPFRAFTAERRARGDKSRSWLFFGTRAWGDDFLYRQEWEGALEDGSLTRMDVAFSRDFDRKVYVQDRLLEHGKALHSWLESGAAVYVCGDAASMAPAVHGALLQIIQNHGQTSREDAIDYLRRLARESRYRRSIY